MPAWPKGPGPTVAAGPRRRPWSNATVLEVRAPDRVGVLYRVTKALADLQLDIRHAKVQTLGHEVVDSFYVRDANGAKGTDPFYLGELERALLHALTSP